MVLCGLWHCRVRGEQSLTPTGGAVCCRPATGSGSLLRVKAFVLHGLFKELMQDNGARYEPV